MLKGKSGRRVGNFEKDIWKQINLAGDIDRFVMSDHIVGDNSAFSGTAYVPAGNAA